MPDAVPPSMRRSFRAVADVVYAGESHEAVHLQLCRAAVDLVDGCDHASLVLVDRGRVDATVASDPVARAADAMERELGHGPCLDALDDDRPDEHLCADLENEPSEWPDLARRYREELGIFGMAGFRLRRDGRKVGALNVFSERPGALTAQSMDQISLLVSFASVALVALERGDEARTLRHGLESNREIGKAIGLLMASHGVDDAEAFGLLSRVSQEMNLKVAEVAAQLISRHGAAPIAD